MKKLYMAIALILIIASGYSLYKLHEIGNCLTELNGKYIQALEQIEKAHEEAKAELAEIAKKEAEKTTTSLGIFTVTAYCKCEKCCGRWSDYPTASGTQPTEGRTIAVDPSVIALGEKVTIDGTTYIAEDTGSAIKGNRIDMYFDSHAEAVAYGKKTKEVLK